METYSIEEYNKKYGNQGAWSNLPAQPAPGTRPSITETVANAFKGGVNQVKEGFQQAGQGGGNPINLLEGIGKIGSGAVSAAFSPLAPITEPTIGAATKYAADKISDIPAVQKFANTKAGETTARVAGDVANYANIAGAVGGAMEVPKVGTAVKTGTQDALASAKAAAGEAAAPLKSAVRDIVPTTENVVNHQVTQALDLTASDVKNISKATGNEVGQFLADKNLIGENVPATQGLLKNFFKKNYDLVRTEIGKVTKPYKQTEVPRYTEALMELKKQVKDVPGLQKVNAEVDGLLAKAGSENKRGNFMPNKKAQITLNDVQRVKELMDDHFNLYKVTGDVKEGVAKEGLSNIRGDLRGFIEKQVEKNTGTDIKELNNNVSTAKSIMGAIEDRSTAGLTRSHLSTGDYGAFIGGTAVGGPVAGAVAVFLKKLYQSPSIKLRIAKYLDTLSDAKKAAIEADLQSGKVPAELQSIAKVKTPKK